MVAWIPMLAGDKLAAAREAARTFEDTSVVQYWDGAQLLGLDVAHTLGVDALGPAWDVYLFFPPDARWDDHVPAPAAALAQVAGVVVASKGVLPAHGEASKLPEVLRGRVDVVGEQPELAELLAAVAKRFER